MMRALKFLAAALLSLPLLIAFSVGIVLTALFDNGED